MSTREPASEERDAEDGAPVTAVTACTTTTATRAATTGVETTASRPEMYFLAHNVAKKHNVGTIARCCTAFGVKSLVLIGSREYNAFGAHGADGHVRFEHFDSLGDARKKLKEERGCTQILGVEIVEDARPIESHPFTGNTAFIMGNEGHGMTEQQKAICDGFVYIRQHGPGTASLNVSVAASIVMHHFALWAGYDERSRLGEKYVVAERPIRTHKRGIVSGSPDEIRARRAAARLKREAEEKSSALPVDDDAPAF